MMQLKSQTLQFKTYRKQIAYVGTTDINKKSDSESDKNETVCYCKSQTHDPNHTQEHKLLLQN